VALLFGHPMQSDGAYWYALAFTVGGAAVFSVSRGVKGSRVAVLEGEVRVDQAVPL